MIRLTFNEKKYLKEVERYDVFQRRYLEAIGLLLWSIRSDWSNAKSVKTRAKAAICLIDMIDKNCLFESEEFGKAGKEYMTKLKKSIEDYLKGDSGKIMDGRYFRANFPEGYQGICPFDFGHLEEDE